MNKDAMTVQQIISYAVEEIMFKLEKDYGENTIFL